MKNKIIYLALLISIPSILNAQNIGMVKDMNTSSSPIGSNPNGFTSVGNTVYFAASDAVHGEELWQYTEEGGAKMVADIHKGDSWSSVEHLTNIDGILYFSAWTRELGEELWMYDGHNPPHILFDLISYTGDGYKPNSSKPHSITPYQDGFVFYAQDTLNYYTECSMPFYDESLYYYNTKTKELAKLHHNEMNLAHNPITDRSYIPTHLDHFWRINQNEETGIEPSLLLADTSSIMTWDVMTGPKSSRPQNIITFQNHSIFTATAARGKILFEMTDSLRFWGVCVLESNEPHYIRAINDTLWFCDADSLGVEYVCAYTGDLSMPFILNEENDWNNGVHLKEIRGAMGNSWFFTKKDTINPTFYKHQSVTDNSHESYSTDIINAFYLFSREDNSISTIDRVLDVHLDKGYAHFNGGIVVNANDGILGNELWFINKSGKTTLLADIVQGSKDSDIRGVSSVDSKIFVKALNVEGNIETWQSNAKDGLTQFYDHKHQILSQIHGETSLKGKTYCIANYNDSPYLWMENGGHFESMRFTQNFEWIDELKRKADFLYFTASLDGTIAHWQYDGEQLQRYYKLDAEKLEAYFNSKDFPYWDEKVTALDEDSLFQQFIEKDKKYFDEHAYKVGDKYIVSGYNPKYGNERWVYTDHMLPELLFDFDSDKESGDVIFNNDKAIGFYRIVKDTTMMLISYDGLKAPKQLQFNISDSIPYWFTSEDSYQLDGYDNLVFQFTKYEDGDSYIPNPESIYIWDGINEFQHIKASRKDEFEIEVADKVLYAVYQSEDGYSDEEVWKINIDKGRFELFAKLPQMGEETEVDVLTILGEDIIFHFHSYVDNDKLWKYSNGKLECLTGEYKFTPMENLVVVEEENTIYFVGQADGRGVELWQVTINK